MGMEDRDGVIWFDGEMVPWREAKVHVLTHSLHYGMGVFEGVRAYKTARGTALFRLPEHIERLFTSAHILQMHIPFSREQIADACLAAIRDNGLEDGYVRPLVFYGSEAMGVSAPNLSVHVVVAAWTWGAYLGDGALERGVRLRTSSYSRHHVNVTMCRT
jgi:branched-chain amino acid aminotransferase